MLQNKLVLDANLSSYRPNGWCVETSYDANMSISLKWNNQFRLLFPSYFTSASALMGSARMENVVAD